MWRAKEQVVNALTEFRRQYEAIRQEKALPHGAALTLAQLEVFSTSSHRTVQRVVAELVKEGRVSVSFSDSREKLVSLASPSVSPATGRASSRGSSAAKRVRRTSLSGGGSGRSLKR